jgi:hypothetical protein
MRSLVLAILITCLLSSNSRAGEQAGTDSKGITEGQAQKILLEERRQRMEKFVQEVKALATKYRCILVPEITIRGDKIEGRIVPMPVDDGPGAESGNPRLTPRDNLPSQ